MQEVLLVIHLILALAIIGLVLLQRSEGGGLGIGGGGGVGRFASRKGQQARTKSVCAGLFLHRPRSRHFGGQQLQSDKVFFMPKRHMQKFRLVQNGRSPVAPLAEQIYVSIRFTLYSKRT